MNQGTYCNSVQAKTEKAWAIWATTVRASDITILTVLSVVNDTDTATATGKAEQT